MTKVYQLSCEKHGWSFEAECIVEHGKTSWIDEQVMDTMRVLCNDPYATVKEVLDELLVNGVQVLSVWEV